MKVEADNPWNDTGLDVEEGERLRFTVSGEWWDASHHAYADGYDPPLKLRYLGWLRRRPRGRWFELSGAIGRTNRNAFAIGAGGTLTMPAGGRLFLFANDVAGFYFNNRGALEVQIERLKD